VEQRPDRHRELEPEPDVGEPEPDDGVDGPRAEAPVVEDEVHRLLVAGLGERLGDGGRASDVDRFGDAPEHQPDAHPGREQHGEPGAGGVVGRAVVGAELDAAEPAHAEEDRHPEQPGDHGDEEPPEVVLGERLGGLERGARGGGSDHGEQHDRDHDRGRREEDRRVDRLAQRTAGLGVGGHSVSRLRARGVGTTARRRAGQARARAHSGGEAHRGTPHPVDDRPYAACPARPAAGPVRSAVQLGTRPVSAGPDRSARSARARRRRARRSAPRSAPPP
jgi:hypothetical protein